MANPHSQFAAFPNGGSVNTLRFLVDAQQKIEIGLRIKQLRDGSAETSRSIADYCEVSVEAVRNWIAGKGIAYDNAKKVAKLFEVDEGWLWRGESPDVVGALTGGADAKLDEILVRLAAIEAALLSGDVSSLTPPRPRGKKSPAATGR